jgi:hypothetical protein
VRLAAVYTDIENLPFSQENPTPGCGIIARAQCVHSKMSGGAIHPSAITLAMAVQCTLTTQMRHAIFE